jgi:hypothetical protein
MFNEPQEALVDDDLLAGQQVLDQLQTVGD